MPSLLLYFHICIIVVLEAYVTIVSARHIAWGLKNGAYIHPSLGYYKHGMYAINGPVLGGEVLAKIPISLELKCEECSLETFTYKFKEALNDNSHFWNPYLKSLPTNCQLPLCNEPDKSILTHLGYKSVKSVLPKPMNNISAMIASRRWPTGMRPVLDLFNHDANIGDIVRINNDRSHYVLAAKKTYKVGSEVFCNYGSERSVFQMYNRYGFLTDQKKLTCVDLRMMRIGNASERIECISNSPRDNVTTLQHMVTEMQEALLHHDYAMLKGAARWIDRNVNTAKMSKVNRYSQFNSYNRISLNDMCKIYNEQQGTYHSFFFRSYRVIKQDANTKNVTVYVNNKHEVHVINSLPIHSSPHLPYFNSSDNVIVDIADVFNEKSWQNDYCGIHFSEIKLKLNAEILTYDALPTFVTNDATDSNIDSKSNIDKHEHHHVIEVLDTVLTNDGNIMIYNIEENNTDNQRNIPIRIYEEKLQLINNIGNTRSNGTREWIHESEALPDVFNHIAKHNLWRNNESRSGGGSTVTATKTVRNCLNQWIEKYQIKSIVDCASGDMNWQPLLNNFEQLDFKAFDISEHIKAVSKYPIKILDITKEIPPAADLFILRDVLQHLPLNLGRNALRNVIEAAIKKSSTGYVAVTSFDDVEVNIDIDTGSFYKNNIHLEPFPKIQSYASKPLEKCLNYYGTARNEYPDMYLYLYRVL